MKFGIHIKIIDQYGKTEKEFEANSIVRGFIDQLQACMNQVNVVNGSVNLAGTTVDINAGANAFYTYKAEAQIDGGIQVGTGSGAVSVSNYSLGTRILHGNTSGKLYYGAAYITNPTTSGSTRSFTQRRSFTNNSGADITVTEIGMGFLSGSGNYTLIDRTLNTFTIPNGTSKTIEYTFSITV